MPPQATPDPSSITPYILLETTHGRILFELYTSHAPITCHNFATLSLRGYYTSTLFHRIIPAFMAQGGDPTGTGRGGESMWNRPFEDEINPALQFTGAGILAMANSGPDTNGSQFFVTLAPTPWLQGKHTIFGRVRRGMKTVQKMGMVRTDKEDRPREEVRVLKVRGMARDEVEGEESRWE